MATALIRGKKFARKAFSLVEVCLALGIISFSLISMIGLLPTGMGALRDSKDQMLHARILQQINGDMLNASTSGTSNSSGSLLYFDSDGQWLGTSNTNSTAYYVVEFSNESPSLPGLDNSAQSTFDNYLKRVRVGISKAQTFNTPTNSVKWYAIQIATH